MRCALACLLLVATAAHAEPTEGDMIAVIVAQPRSNAAEGDARLLLVKLDVEHRQQELIAWVDRMLAMPQLLYGRQALVSDLQRVQAQARLMASIELQQIATRTRRIEDWRAAAASYRKATVVLLAAARNQSADRAQWALEQEALCLTAAGDQLAALEMYAEVIDVRLTPRAHQAMLGIILAAPARAIQRALTD